MNEPEAVSKAFFLRAEFSAFSSIKGGFADAEQEQ